MEEKFKNIIEISRESKNNTTWEGTCFDYMELVKANPEIAQPAPSRVYNVIVRKGSEPVEENVLPKYEDLVRYNFFKDNLFGLDETLHDLVGFLRAGARRSETGRRILILVGPASSGKSTIAAMLKSGLENDAIPIYAIKGCPIHEEPLHLIPKKERPKWEEVLAGC